ncbi:hypothetical protein F5B20DRAFT_554105 [Whalleya microplaca]|nr:hypothetical protein F5B20DRAFT_554105 [Whalleya microplaca]
MNFSDAVSTEDVAPTVCETFEKHYDLILVVGTSPKGEFKVCSRTLARSNKVFDKMLYGPFLERKPTTGDWVVNLPEDNPSAFQIFLDLVHRFSPAIPQRPAEDTLYHLVSTIHYYNMYDIFQKWGLKSRRKYTTSSSTNSPEALWIAWVFGLENQIENILGNVTNQSKIDSGGRLCFGEKGQPYHLDSHLGEFDLESK